MPTTPGRSVYDSERVATAYAFDRPPVHELILRRAGLDRRARRALDIGCGAGLSTAALEPYADQVTGVEPVARMLAHHRKVAPKATFVNGTAERLPFAGRRFDLVTAAGSLNYTDLPAALAEIARVLTEDGKFLLYDFSEGRRADNNDALENWFGEFEQRYPWPAGWRPLDPRTLPVRTRRRDHTDFELRTPMTLDDYLRYTVSGINVDTPEEAAVWCRETLTPIFAGETLTVLIPGYLATLELD
jgi:SAM-dependent methyltransferase